MVQPQEDFGVRRVPVPSPNSLEPGYVLVRVLWVSCDPAMRGWMTDAPSYVPPVQIGDAMRAAGVGQVVAGSDIKRGELVYVEIIHQCPRPMLDVQ
jgi:NADPH-dependent curcumin reductase CurA